MVIILINLHHHEGMVKCYMVQPKWLLLYME